MTPTKILGLIILLSLLNTPTYADINIKDLLSKQGSYIYSDSTYSNLGSSVQVIGDINGDGLPDFIIGDYSYDSNRGRAAVIYGQRNDLPDIHLSSLQSSEGFIITGERQDDYFGWIVASAGDFNGDKIPDYMILAKGATNGISGRVYIVYGTNNMGAGKGFSASAIGNAKHGIIIGSADSNTPLDYYISPAGDMNGDGFDDIMVSSSAQGMGIVFVIYGSNDFLPVYTIDTNAYVGMTLPFTGTGCISDGQGFCIFTSSYSPTALGVSLSAIGDLNSDGYGDIMVASKNFAFIVYGDGKPRSDVDITNLRQNQGKKLIPEKNGEVVVCGGGDFNGDKVPDILVSDNSNNVIYGLYGDTRINNQALYLSNMDSSQGFN
jgi:hypothetical protein